VQCLPWELGGRLDGIPPTLRAFLRPGLRQQVAASARHVPHVPTACPHTRCVYFRCLMIDSVLCVYQM
jgi:hypothetical protein